MKLDNFKELLLKKSEDNQNLQVLIKYIRDDFLVDHVVESLEKMARSYSKKNPNHAIMHFGTHMDEHTEGDMFHDALSHHASHYKSALDSGNKKVADQHMKQIFKMMHMGEKLTRDGLNDHSHGKLRIEAIDPKPWERSGFRNTKNRKGEDSGKFTTDTKGWGRQNVSHYDWLRGNPYVGSNGGAKDVDPSSSYHKEIKAHGNSKAYPLNKIKVNDKFLHIDDVEHGGEFVEHGFDSHPIMSHYSTSPKSYDSLKHDDYLKSHDEYHAEGGAMDAYWDLVESRNPNIKRGAEMHPGIHADIEGLNLDDEPAKVETPAAAVSAEPKALKVPDAGQKLPDKAPSLDEMRAKLDAIRGKK